MQVYMGVTMLTKSKWRPGESSGGSRRLGARAIEDAVTRVEVRGMRMEYATREWFGGLSLKTTGWQVIEFGPQNPGAVPVGFGGSTWRHREACVEAKLSHE